MDKIRELMKKINSGGWLRENEPMSRHTSFQTGGPAQLYAEPPDAGALANLLDAARREKLPVFILGGGANILAADRGIPGLVVNTCCLREAEILKADSGENGYYIKAGAGLPISEAAVMAAGAGLAGLEFIYAMPGSVGGAVWMNARCYGFSVSDVLESVSFLEKDTLLERKKGRDDAGFMEGFGYKTSPFQAGREFSGGVILEAVFSLRPGDTNEIEKSMRRIEEDRRAKGHFLAPSAGSVFKNNRAFGEPTGQILDRLGFRNFALGGAKVSPQHANIIINEGDASSADIRGLIEIIQKKTREATGFELEPEIIYAGDW